MSTTLLDVSAGSTAGIQDPFRVALTSGGAIGLSVRVTTGGTALDAFSVRPRLIIIGSNFTDGPTAAADIQTQLAGGGAVALDIEVSETASAVRYTEGSFISSGPVMYGYLDFPEALSADIGVEVEALEL